MESEPLAALTAMSLDNEAVIPQDVATIDAENDSLSLDNEEVTPQDVATIDAENDSTPGSSKRPLDLTNYDDNYPAELSPNSPAKNLKVADGIPVTLPTSEEMVVVKRELNG